MITERHQPSSAQSVLAQSIALPSTDYPQSVAHPFHTSSCENFPQLFWSQFIAHSVQNNGRVYYASLSRHSSLAARHFCLRPLDSVLTTNPCVTPLDSVLTKNCRGGCGISLLLPHVSTFNLRRSTQILPLSFSSTYKSLFQQLPCFHIYTKRRGMGGTMPLSHFGPHSSGRFMTWGKRQRGSCCNACRDLRTIQRSSRCRPN